MSKKIIEIKGCADCPFQFMQFDDMGGGDYHCNAVMEDISFFNEYDRPEFCPFNEFDSIEVKI